LPADNAVAEPVRNFFHELTPPTGMKDMDSQHKNNFCNKLQGKEGENPRKNFKIFSKGLEKFFRRFLYWCA
jgi:hypothetical protein